MSDPFGELGLDGSASADDVRRARRDLAKEAHPDAGGDAAQMQRVNAAAAAALQAIAARSLGTPPRRNAPDDAGRPTGSSPRGAERDDASGLRHDAPSFTVEALPVETFEALLLAAATLGEVEDDDPPYELGVLLGEPLACWCRLSVVPDAGASTVSVAIAPADGAVLPAIEAVRDAWISALNRLDWSEL